MNAMSDLTINTVRSTIHRMLEDRGYEQETEDQYVNEQKDRILVNIIKPVSLDSSHGIDVFKEIVTKMEKLDIHHSILASYRGFTHPVIKERDEIKDRNKIELFKFHELMYVVVDHFSVLPHVRIGMEERTDLIQKLGIREGTESFILPNIKIADAICKYYDYKLGDIIRIERSPNNYYYRIVVD
jgi:DNA-directed RNA polymerase subunit H (RpoH/RPB5)